MNLLSPQNKSLILFFLFAGIAIAISLFLIVIAITFFPITIGIFLIVKFTPVSNLINIIRLNTPLPKFIIKYMTIYFIRVRNLENYYGDLFMILCVHISH